MNFLEHAALQSSATSSTTQAQLNLLLRLETDAAPGWVGRAKRG